MPNLITTLKKKAVQVALKSTLLRRFSTPYISEVSDNGMPTFWSYDITGNAFNRHTFQDFISQGFAQNPYVYMVANRIAEVAPKLPYKFEDKITGKDVEITGEIAEFVEILNNSDEGYDSFMQKVSAYLSITGNTMLRKVSNLGRVIPVDEGEVPRELEVLHIPDIIINTVNDREWGLPKSYTVENYGTGTETLGIYEVIHCKFPNIVARTNWGLAPLFSGQPIYEASNNEFFAESVLHRNMGADGIVSRKGGHTSMILEPKEKHQLENSFSKDTKGSVNFGKLHFTNAEIEYTSLRMDPSRLKTLELNAKNLRLVASIYNLDAKIFGDPQASAFNNYNEANISAFENCYVPHTNFIYDCLTKYILSDIFGIDNVKMCVNTELIPILNQRDLNYEKELREQVKLGIITIDEFRRMVHPDLGDLPNEEPQNEPNNEEGNQ